MATNHNDSTFQLEYEVLCIFRMGKIPYLRDFPFRRAKILVQSNMCLSSMSLFLHACIGIYQKDSTASNRVLDTWDPRNGDLPALCAESWCWREVWVRIRVLRCWLLHTCMGDNLNVLT